MPIYTPIIIKSGSVEVFSTDALEFKQQNGDWRATLQGPKAAAVHLAVLQKGRDIDFFVDDDGPGDRLLKADLGANRSLELKISSGGTVITICGAHETPGKAKNRKFYKFPNVKVDNVGLWADRSKLAYFDDVKELVVMVQTPDVVRLPTRRGGKVGSGIAFAAIGLIAGLAAGAFLAGGLDDGGW